jgi:hypothetical protein
MSVVSPVSEQKRPNVRNRRAWTQAWSHAHSWALSWMWSRREPAPLDLQITEEEVWKDLRWGRS